LFFLTELTHSKPLLILIVWRVTTATNWNSERRTKQSLILPSELIGLEEELEQIVLAIVGWISQVTARIIINREEIE
jgi:hypothetical protein